MLFSLLRDRALCIWRGIAGLDELGFCVWGCSRATNVLENLVSANFASADCNWVCWQRGWCIVYLERNRAGGLNNLRVAGCLIIWLLGFVVSAEGFACKWDAIQIGQVAGYSCGLWYVFSQEVNQVGCGSLGNRGAVYTMDHEVAPKAL